MFQLTEPPCEARLLQMQDRLRESEATRRIQAAQPVPASPTRISTGALARLAAFVGTLAQDSRETLRTKEQDLANWGMAWSQDPTHDEGLAMELPAARARRQASPELPVVAAPVAPAKGLRWTLGAALVRIGERVEGLPRPATAD